MARLFTKKTLLIGLLLPVIYFAGVLGLFLYKVNTDNRNQLEVTLPEIKKVETDTRLLVFAPHPDDETLGCAGIIQKTIASGGHVRVVFISAGDGYRVAVARQLRKIDLTPKDYVEFANIRRGETIKALANLGLHENDVQYLGYPDRGLLPMWNDFWKSNKLYRSPYTGSDHSPYSFAFRKSTPYCGEKVLADVLETMIDYRPTSILVTHPSDDHPDHTASSSFVTLAYHMASVMPSSKTWRATLSYYLVHRGDWPTPQGLFKDEKLYPPKELRNLDTKWDEFTLDSDSETRKQKSIEQYDSQIQITRRFLESFVRKTEIFGSIPNLRIPKVPITTSKTNNGDKWTGIQPVILDPVNDSALRGFQRGADIKEVYAAKAGDKLIFKIITNGNMSQQMSFRLRVRGISYFKQKVFEPSVIDKKASKSGSFVEFELPSSSFQNCEGIAISVESRSAGIVVDSTGVRFLGLQ